MGDHILHQSVFVQFTELTRRYKLPCTTCVSFQGECKRWLHHHQLGSLRGTHARHHIVLSCRWTPHGPYWGSGETPVRCVKSSSQLDIKNSMLGSAHRHFKIHGPETPQGCVGCNIQEGMHDVDVRYISETKMSNRELQSRPLRARGLRERGIWWILWTFHGFLPHGDLWEKNGSYANGMHSMEEKFPTSWVWKGLSLPMPGLLNGPFLLPLKVYEVEQANCKGN